jgi:hypothetical protein
MAAVDEVRTMKKTRDIVFIFLGVAGLLLKRHYSGPLDELVHAYLGNIAASFAVYFNANLLPIQWKHRGIVSACLALAVVESFEATNGFGIMSNTFDPFDFLANALGIALAMLVDTLVKRNQTA